MAPFCVAVFGARETPQGFNSYLHPVAYGKKDFVIRGFKVDGLTNLSGISVRTDCMRETCPHFTDQPFVFSLQLLVISKPTEKQPGTKQNGTLHRTWGGGRPSHTPQTLPLLWPSEEICLCLRTPSCSELSALWS